MYGTLRLNWYDPLLSSKTNSNRAIKYEKIVYEHDWSNLESAARDSGDTTPVSGSHQLRAGNHQFPFEVIIPGSIDESVEGLEDAQVIYKLVATIERGRFANNLVAKRHLRVVRTLGTDILELAQTMCIDNVWPKKVQYSISIPAKAVPIGSVTPITFTFSPLLKGLKLGRTKVKLVGFKTLRTTADIATSSEKVVSEVVIPPPDHGFEGQDEWSFIEVFRIPSSLTKVTQDCRIGSHLKISHKFRFSISLVNPDGHVSELRASVPITLFISPNVHITSRQQDSSTSTRPLLTHRSSSHDDHEDLLFSAESHSADHTVNLGISAPPSYSDHIYDTLWGDIPTPQVNTPLTSGQSTPRLLSRSGSSSDINSSGFGAHDRSRLLSNLYALQERQARGDPDISSVLEASSHGTSLNTLHGSAVIGSYTSMHNPRTLGAISPEGNMASGSSSPHHPSGIAIPGTASPHHFDSLHNSPLLDFHHFSPATSPPHTTSDGVASQPMDVQALSRVPSYNTAITSITPTEVDYTPSYDHNGRASDYFHGAQVLRSSTELPSSTTNLNSTSPASSSSGLFHPSSSSIQRLRTSSGAAPPSASAPSVSGLSLQLAAANLAASASGGSGSGSGYSSQRNSGEHVSSRGSTRDVSPSTSLSSASANAAYVPSSPSSNNGMLSNSEISAAAASADDHGDDVVNAHAPSTSQSPVASEAPNTANSVERTESKTAVSHMFEQSLGENVAAGIGDGNSIIEQQ